MNINLELMEKYAELVADLTERQKKGMFKFIIKNIEKFKTKEEFIDIVKNRIKIWKK